MINCKDGARKAIRAVSRCKYVYCSGHSNTVGITHGAAGEDKLAILRARNRSENPVLCSIAVSGLVPKYL